MAETDSGQERTEEATPRRLEKAREEGQVARSRELNTAFVLLMGVGGLIAFGPGIGRSMLALMHDNFALERGAAFDPNALMGHLLSSGDQVLRAFAPLLILLLVAALAGPVSLGGVLFSSKALMPKGSRINPLNGLKRMFSLNALVELAKALAKFCLVAGIAAVILLNIERQLLQLGAMALNPAMGEALRITGWAVLGISSVMILIALVDVPYQMFDHRKKLKMTRQEVKDEYKDTEGKPEVKSRIRQLQRELAQRRMMEAVPQADVVITNPEHFAVALRYQQDKDNAPIVVAKGADQIAFKIREIARLHGITELPAPMLARAIYYTADLEEAIPGPLYVAVAQVLAYVFQLKAHRTGRAERPQPPKDLPIPEPMRFDSRGKRMEGDSR